MRIHGKTQITLTLKEGLMPSEDDEILANLSLTNANHMHKMTSMPSLPDSKTRKEPRCVFIP